MSFISQARTMDRFVDLRGKSSEAYRTSLKCQFVSIEKFCLERYEKHLSEILEDLKVVKDIQTTTEDLIQDYINWHEERGNGAKSTRSYSSTFANFLKWRRLGFDLFELKKNVVMKKDIENEAYPLTLKEIKSLLDFCKEKEKTKYLIMLSGGLRIREVLGIRKRDIETDLERYVIHVNPKYAKGKKARSTIISFEAMEYLDKIMQRKLPDDFIFPHNQNDIKTATINEANLFSRVRKRAGLDEYYEESKVHKVTTHSFRAFFISQFEKTSSGFGHSLSGHSKYMKQYERFTLEEKVEVYLKTEHLLLVWSKSEQEVDNSKVERELAEMKKLLGIALKDIEELRKSKS